MSSTAFMQLGYHEEARAWRDWLFRAVAGRRAHAEFADRFEIFADERVRGTQDQSLWTGDGAE